MKIIRVIVDELPLSANMCFFAHRVYDEGMRLGMGSCSILRRETYIAIREYYANRCPDCPLALEHDKEETK